MAYTLFLSWWNCMPKIIHVIILQIRWHGTKCFWLWTYVTVGMLCSASWFILLCCKGKWLHFDWRQCMSSWSILLPEIYLFAELVLYEIGAPSIPWQTNEICKMCQKAHNCRPPFSSLVLRTFISKTAVYKFQYKVLYSI